MPSATAEIIFMRLQACTDMEGMKKWFLDKTSEICSNMESAREKEAVSIIEKAKSYIRDNYKKDISLDEVSREVDISPLLFQQALQAGDRRKLY